MIVLFWDIDGTLLTTARAGVFAWEDSVRELTGRDFSLSVIRTAGMTDYQIALRTLETMGVDAHDENVKRLLHRYEELLPASLPRRTGRVLDNVREILDHLTATRSDVRSYLLTGNTRAGARAKLTHYDLAHFFADGAFAEDTRARSTIATRALELARRAGPVGDETIFVVGDTPHDIECAKAIGAKTIAVATGGYSVDELRGHGPWRLYETLPPPAEFESLLDVPSTESDPKAPVQA
jgi:phosphoglycolate phosphatase-like HAD superfamily hydrolase